MISARLIKNLEPEGFALDFPGYASNEERIMEIIKENNERLLLALPLLFQYPFDYESIRKEIGNKIRMKILNRIILITEKIFQKERILDRPLQTLQKIISKYSIQQKISKEEFKYYYGSFIESKRRKWQTEEKTLEKQIDIRGKLHLNKALSTLYSPGKLRIMQKIFNHEPLTNTELKYYYRSIRPLILAILNENLQKYARLIESIKKYSS